MTSKRILQLASVALVALCSGRARAGTIYDLTSNFAAASDPTSGSPTSTNGVFSYGSYAGGLNPATFATFKTFGPVGTGNYANLYMEATNSGGIDPNIIYNAGPSFNTGPDFGGIQFNAGRVTFGPYQGPTVARFTAPTGGEYAIRATFQAVQDGNTSPTAYLFEDSSRLVAPITVSSTPATLSDTVYLKAGDTLDIVLFGGNIDNKTTQVGATITAVPEPSTLVMVGTAALVGLAHAARRRKATA